MTVAAFLAAAEAAQTHEVALDSVPGCSVRVVITGLLHPFHLPGGNQENLLVYDYAIGGLTPAIEYKGGRISAVQMRVS